MANNKMTAERKATPLAASTRATPGLSSTKALLVIRLLILLGLGITIYLSVLHLRAGTQGNFSSPLCSLSATINCNAVLGSSYARLFGLPIAVWAALTYAVMLGVSFIGSRSMLIMLCCWTFAFSLYMAGVSFFSIKAACLFCMSLYAINTGLLVSALSLARTVRDFSFQKALYSLAACMVLALGLGWVQAQARAGRLSSGEDFHTWYEKQPRVTLTTTERHSKGNPQATVTVSEFVDFR